MPVSIRRYTELKLAISDYLQSGNWTRLYELCGTADEETAKTIAVIFTFYDPKRIWKFLTFVRNQEIEARRERRDSVATACYVIGKMGQSDTAKSLDYLKHFLSDDHMLRNPVLQAVSNLWVLDPKKTERIIMKSWILSAADEDDLQEIGVRSATFLAEQSPASIAFFLRKVSALKNRKVASKAAEELLETYVLQERRRVAPKVQRKK